jgi:hypothetical protein
MKYSRGTPTRIPRMSPVSAAVASGTGASREVESSGSCPAMTFSRIAASVTSRVSTPTWSSEEAKAMRP